MVITPQNTVPLKLYLDSTLERQIGWETIWGIAVFNDAHRIPRDTWHQMLKQISLW